MLAANTRRETASRTCSIDGELFTLANGDLAEQRQKVEGHAERVLAHDTAGVSASRVKVAEECSIVARTSIDLVADNKLNHHLCVSIGVRRAERAVLGDGYHVVKGSIAVDGRRTGKHNALDIVGLHDTHEGNCAADIDAVVLERNLARLSNSLQRRKVNDRVDFWVLVENGSESSLVCHVDIVEGRTTAANLLNSVERLLGRVVEIVDNDNIVVGLEKLKNGKRANVACATASISTCSDQLKGRWKQTR